MPPPGDRLSQLDTPCLIVDLSKLEQNITSMANRARSEGIRLRPHFKAHKSIAIARRQMSAGASGFTVAKLDEAEVLLDGGLDDILVASQIVSDPKISRAVELSRRGSLILAVDSITGAQRLSAAAIAAGVSLNVSIEVDSGLRRCGVTPEAVGPLAKRIAGLPGIELTGAFTHAGHAYAASSSAEVRDIAHDEIKAMRESYDSGIRASVTLPVLSIGSTPTVLALDRRVGVDEMRPGNYVFLDNIQIALGVAKPEQCALTVLATIMSRPAADRVVVDAGSKTLGLDKGAHGQGTVRDFGRLVGEVGSLVRLSEEHGVAEIAADSSLEVGSKILISPNHACSVANLHKRYIGVRDGRIEEELAIDAGQGVH